MKLWKRFRGLTYRILYKFGEWHEKFELGFIFFELVLIAYIVAPRSVFGRDFGSVFDNVYFNRIGSWMHGGEFVAGGVLMLLALTRIGILVRRRGLGYRYTNLANWMSGPEIETAQLFHAIKKVKWGRPPGLSDEADDLQRIADRIAHHTAGLLSIRTLYDIDEIWRQRERESLGEWFDRFPAALWHLPATDEIIASNLDEIDTSGYFSVIIPMTAASNRSIRRGQRATDLAEVASDIAALFHTNRFPIQTIGNGSLRVELMAYLHVFVPSRRDDSVNEQRLFAASIQHMAFLLYALYGSTGEFWTKWNFAILCESANERMGRLLSHLGFKPLLQVSHERTLGPIVPCKSYAGFQLYEFDVNMGELPGDAVTADGREFLHLLKDRVREYAVHVTTEMAQ